MRRPVTHSNLIIPWAKEGLSINATIRHELIIDALISLARGDRRDPAALRNFPHRIGIQIGKKCIHGMDAVVMRDLGLDAIRQKLPIHFAATDHPCNGLIGNRGERFVNAMYHVDALGRKALVAREHDIASVLERTPTGKTQQRLATHNDRATFGARHKMAHVGAIGHHHIALAANTPVVTHGDDGR